MEVAGAGGDSAAEGAESKHTHTHINTTQAGDSRINHTAFTLPTRLSYRRRGENKGVRDPEGQGARGEGRHPPGCLKTLWPTTCVSFVRMKKMIDSLSHTFLCAESRVTIPVRISSSSFFAKIPAV